MKQHPHAEVLRAIADGVPLSEFEISKSTDDRFWDSLVGYSEWINKPDHWQIRRKQQYIPVNGFKVPKPLEVLPEDGDVFSPSLMMDELFASWNCSMAKTALERGIAHATQEAAIAHAKAMLGIDPYL